MKSTIFRLSPLVWRVSFFAFILCALAVTIPTAFMAGTDGFTGESKTLPLEIYSSKSVNDTNSLPVLREDVFGPLPTVLTALPQQGQPPTLETYQENCTTPKTVFALGETVCVKVGGIDPILMRRLAWIDPSGLVRNFTPVSADPQSTSFTLPVTESSVVSGVFVVENRGKWKVNVVSARGSAILTAPFAVQGATPTVDVSIGQGLVSGTVEAGFEITLAVAITNFGPNDATNVEFTDPTPLNATFVSVAQMSGPDFSCNGGEPVVCTRATLSPGETAVFHLRYTAGAGGSIITNIASVTSDTTELNSEDNTASSGRINIPGNGASATCFLECPNDITVAANADQDGPGAFVNFATPESSGECGSVTSTPASGSFFRVGTTIVNATSGTGSGACTFAVTVVDAAAPTVTCPLPDITAQATEGQIETDVTIAAPSATGSDVILSSTRSDNRDLTDPYPVGVTIVTWRATDQYLRTASCSQRVVVTAADAPTISCPANLTFNASGCDLTLTAAQIGTPETTGTGVVVEAQRSDSQALSDPFPAGATFVTWTATDNTGRVVSCVQKITITTSGSDSTAPILNAPADVTVSTASCSAVLDDEIGVATSEDECSSSVSIVRTGVPAGFVFPTGTTNITYVATDAAGNTTTAIQRVTVTEGTAPTITAPANVSFTTGPTATACSVFVTDSALGSANANDNCPGVTTSRSGIPAGNLFPVGDTFVTYIATDTSGNTASAVQKVTVTDNTAPTISAPPAVTLFTGPGATSCDVTVTNLDATLGTAAASDNCGTVTVIRGGGSVFPLGETNITYTATDAYGNIASATQRVTVVDNTPPTISCPSNIVVSLPLNSPATNMAVNYPNPATAADNCAGPVTLGYSVPSGSVFPVGTTTVTATATDAHGNSASCTFTVTVLYNFTGFFSPVNNLPTLNSVNAGRAIPVKFSLSGNKGLNIFAVGSPYTVSFNCNSQDPGVDVIETVTPGGSELTYNSSSDQYNYVWTTQGSWAGTCRQLVVKLSDGSEHRANFRFR